MPDYLLKLLPAGLCCPASEARSLLASAEAAGIDLPSSCRNGTCRTCISRVQTGAVRHLAEWPGLSRDELAAGWILPCIAVPLSDVTIEAPAARLRK